MVPLTLGTATTATITAARENRAFSFRVTAGQRFPVEATASGLRSRGGATPEVNVRAVDPVTGYQGAGPFTVDAPPDPWQYEAAGTGTARIIVDPVGDTTATATFTVSALTDVTASLVLGRATTAVATLPGQNVVFSVPAIGGSTPPAFRVSGVSMTAPLSSGPAAAQVQLRRSGGSFESLADLSPTTTALIHNPQGSYDPAQSGQLVITPSENTTVALTVTMVRSKVTTVAVTPGRPTKVTFANPGDCTVLTFAATGGKWVAVVESQLTVQPGADRADPGHRWAVLPHGHDQPELRRVRSGARCRPGRGHRECAWCQLRQSRGHAVPGRRPGAGRDGGPGRTRRVVAR